MKVNMMFASACLCLFVASCSGGARQCTASSTQGSHAMAYASVVMAAVHPAGECRSAGTTYDVLIASLFEKSVETAGDHAYTTGELIRLGVWEDAAGFEHSLRTLAMMMRRFYALEDHVPDSSDEVISALGGTPDVLGNLYNPIADG